MASSDPAQAPPAPPAAAPYVSTVRQPRGEFVPQSDARFNQHRCHARMTDAVEAVWSARGGGMERLSLFVACLRSDPGAEPTDPPTIHPADFYRLRLRGEPSKK